MYRYIVVTVPPPPHPVGAALAGAIAGNPLARQPPEAAAALAECLGAENMFVLAAECATVYGPDLPAMLPCSARRPPSRCLHMLHADTTEALADGGERALRWALKRCLRAAFERERERALAGGEGIGIDTQDATAGGAGGVGVGAAAAGDGNSYYTRDLYHCAALVSDVRPELGEDLAAALVASVHGPRAVWGALWWASGAALCVRLRDAVTV